MVAGLRLQKPMLRLAPLQLGIVRRVRLGLLVKLDHPERRVRMASRAKKVIANRVSVDRVLKVGARVDPLEKADVRPVKVGRVAKVGLKTAHVAMSAGTTIAAASGRISWPTSIWTS